MKMLNRTTSSTAGGLDVGAAWERAKKRWDKMDQVEKLQTFVDAGILTKKGNLTKPYKGAFLENFLSGNRRMTVTEPSENHPTPARATASRR
jgi:hypothetical protein